MSEPEIERLARRLDLGPEQFRAMYTRTLRKGGVSLRERRGGDCVFYDRSSGCRVYRDRPLQCRRWPFWPSVVGSARRWREEASGCPGMGAGRLYSEAEIRVLCRPSAPAPGTS